MKKLFLGSSSYGRQHLLQEAQIPYTCMGHSADETQCDWGLPIEQLVHSIARHKMNHVVLPECKDGEIVYVLTADTLVKDANGVVHGKPISKEDAVDKIRQSRDGASVSTAFCLVKKQYSNGAWHELDRIEQVVSATYVFNIPEKWIERYFEQFSRYLEVSGGVSIEGYGLQFFKSVNGSFTTIIGLPMYEVREALDQLGFF